MEPTEAPDTEAPDTEAPDTEAPATLEPTTVEPTTVKPPIKTPVKPGNTGAYNRDYFHTSFAGFYISKNHSYTSELFHFIKIIDVVQPYLI